MLGELFDLRRSNDALKIAAFASTVTPVSPMNLSALFILAEWLKF